MVTQGSRGCGNPGLEDGIPSGIQQLGVEGRIPWGFLNTWAFASPLLPQTGNPK